MELPDCMGSIRTGHILMTLCCIFYLAWWSITFNPMKSFPATPKYILFVCIAASGFAGLKFLISPLSHLPMVNNAVSLLTIVLTGLAAYVVLLFLTGHFLHRQVTTELLLIVGWTVLELCVLSGVYRADAVTLKYAVIMAGVIIAAALISMICYLFYYKMEPVTAFYDGMVPLILFGIVMAAQIVLI